MEYGMGGTTEIVDEPIAEPESSISDYPSSLAVCLVSGGMDSCVTAAIGQQEDEEIAFLHVSYGQRTETRERQAFNGLARHLGVTKPPAGSIGHLKPIRGAS